APTWYGSGSSLKPDAASLNTSQVAEKLRLMECRLPDVDPWDYQVQYYLDPLRDPMKNCSKNYTQITWMSRGYVVLNETYKKNGTKCDFRCVHPKDDYAVLYSEWKDIWYAPDCDIVEVRCKNSSGDIFYEYLHEQIYKRMDYGKTREWQTTTAPWQKIDIVQPPDFGPENGKGKRRPPDVHIILFDSVSSPQFYRSMRKTVHVLREEFGAVPFKFHNKVGLNSRPNGYALLLGKQGYQLEGSPLNEAHPPKVDMDTWCGLYLEKEPFIGYEFQKAGYKTMMSEDWALGVFNWPSCYGFAKSPVDHYMRQVRAMKELVTLVPGPISASRLIPSIIAQIAYSTPFQLRVEGGCCRESNWSLYYNVYRDSCKEPHHYQLDYLKDFIDAYDDEPKWSITWMSYVAHNDINGLYHVDHEWHRFLRNYKKQVRC
ncbi:Protein R03G8.3, partial [Aphelenchoides avenae]